MFRISRLPLWRHALCLLTGSVLVLPLQAQSPAPEAFRQAQRVFSARMEARGLDQPFRGVSTDGSIVSGLFPLYSTGVSTAPVREAASRFIATLSPAQRDATLFPVDDQEWRKWANQHIYLRQGTSFEEMSPEQREAAWALLETSLSVKGFELTRDIMRLNETLGELNGDDFVQYGEHKYWLTFMGTPSADAPWGWQLDGHHLALNYFVLGDQVVMTPAFWGSEPAVAETGKYAGTRIMEAEQEKGLGLIRALDERQRGQAVLAGVKTGNNNLGEAFSDNLIVDYAGIPVSRFTPEQKALLIDLVALYTGNLDEGHARVSLEEFTRHLDSTWFAWIGGTEDDSVFYYRIQSPVVLIEFDHQEPVGLSHLYPRGVPYREHIHAVVRTPNGNDYGKDLLRQHYQQVEH